MIVCRYFRYVGYWLHSVEETCWVVRLYGVYCEMDKSHEDGVRGRLFKCLSLTLQGDQDVEQNSGVKGQIPALMTFHL